MIRLAAEAAARGHRSTLLAATYWQETAEGQGIRFIGIPPRGGVGEHAALMREFSEIRDNRRLLVAMFRHAARWLDEVVPLLEEALEEADALVVSYLFALYHRLAAERGVPSVSVHFCPNTSLSPLRCPEGLPQPPAFLPDGLRRLWADGLTRAADRYVRSLLNRTVGRPQLRIESFLIPPTDRSLVLAPARPFGFDPENLRPGVAFTGFLQGGFANAKADGPDDDFAGGPFLTFGSVTTGGMAKEFADLYGSWPAARPLTVQRGWFDPPPPPPEKKIRIIGPASHRDCFPRASAVIHHGGAGTTTSAFFAGVPQVIVPHFADQGFWAAAVRRLGCGRRLPRRGWGRRLAETVASLENDPACARAAREFAREHTDPKSAARAIQRIEDWRTTFLPR